MADLDVGSGGVDRGRWDDGTEGTDVEGPLVPQRWVRRTDADLFCSICSCSIHLCRREFVDFCQFLPIAVLWCL